MSALKKTEINIVFISKVQAWVAALVLLLCLAGSVLYLCTGYGQLVDWYRGLNGCFYRSNHWTEFFTPLVKQEGNRYCVLAIIISVSGLLYVYKRKTQKGRLAVSGINHSGIVFLIVALLSGFCAWMWGNRMAMVAFDEAFSAQHISGIHPFQGLSYYMLPNNHLLFCLINNVVFHPFSNKVATGRIISLLAYLGFIATLFLWLRRQLGNNWLACVIVVLLSLQFFVWGLGFQARSYEMCLLASIGLFISVMAYTRFLQRRWAYINVLCTVVGFGCVPSFLYIYAAQLMFIVIHQIIYGRQSIAIWKYQLIALCMVFLFYAPVLCFSGLAAITNNHYVAEMKHMESTGDFCRWMFPYFEQYIVHMFSGLEWKSYALHIPLLLLPVLLFLFHKNKTALQMGIFWVCMWVSFFVTVIVMKRLPFERNITGHYSLCLLASVWTIYELVKAASGKYKVLSTFICTSIFGLLAVYFVSTEKRYLQSTLYEYDVNTVYQEINEGLKSLPTGSVVGFSDEGFYCCQLCMQHGCVVHKCADGTEEYYVTQEAEVLPQFVSNSYVQVKKVGDYFIYRKRD